MNIRVLLPSTVLLVAFHLSGLAICYSQLSVLPMVLAIIGISNCFSNRNGIDEQFLYDIESDAGTSDWYV